MGTFQIFTTAGAAPFGTSGPWYEPSADVQRIGCEPTFPFTGNCGDHEGRITYIFFGNCWSLDGGAAISFAGLPSGFTVTSATASILVTKGNLNECHFTGTIGGVAGPQDDLSWDLGEQTALNLQSSFISVDAITTNAVDSFVNINTGGQGTFAVSGTYEITAYYMDCSDVEIANGILANVCTINQEGIGTPIDLDDFPLQWWNLGIYWLYQPFSPGSGWTSGGTPDFDGWYQSFEEFRGGSLLIDDNTRPHDPRNWDRLQSNGFSANEAFAQGGTGLTAVYNNHLIYARKYGNGSAGINVFDGLSDRRLVNIPPNSDGTEIIDIMSVVQTGGNIYVTTLDDGTNDTNWSGRVFQLDVAAGTLSQLGATFTGGQVPYAVCWYNGRLYVGTNPGDPTNATGFIYSMLPGYDTTWTEEYDISTGDAGIGGVTCMFEFGGKLYFGTNGEEGVSAEILSRSALGAFAWVTENGDGSAAENNAYLSMCEFDGYLYASYWSEDLVSSIVRTSNGTAWTTVHTSGLNKPIIQLVAVNDSLYAVMGGYNTPVELLVATDGTDWEVVTQFLPIASDTVGVQAFAALH